MSPDKSSCINSKNQSRSSQSGAGHSTGNSRSRSRARPMDNLHEFMAITKALADRQRVRGLLALQRGELCVCQVVELLGLAASTVSKHMSILKHAGLVESRKDGRWIYYRLASEDVSDTVRQAIEWAKYSLSRDRQVVLDRQRLATICSSDPHELCSRRDSAKRSRK